MCVRVYACACMCVRAGEDEADAEVVVGLQHPLEREARDERREDDDRAAQHLEHRGVPARGGGGEGDGGGVR